MTKTIDIIIGGFDDGRTPSVQQYDTNSRRLLCRLWEKPGVPYTMSENAVVGAIFKWRKAEPAGEYKTEIIDRSTVLVTIPGDATQVSGAVFAQLVIHQDGGVLRGPEINFMVLESLTAGEEGIENPELLFDKLIEEANAATERANDAADALENISAIATTLPAGREATAQVIDGENGKLLVIGVPEGKEGPKGENADEITIDTVEGLREALEGKQPKGNYLGANDTAKNAEKADDASKLGGIDAAKYATKTDLENIDIPTGGTANVAYNLLDNTYFERMSEIVNQRGFVSGNSGDAGLSIDRWYLQHDTALHLLDDCIGLSGYWNCWQVVGTDLRAGETYTFAVLAKCETGNETFRLSIDTTDASLSQMHFYNIGTDWQVYLITCTPSENMEIGTVRVSMGINTGNEQSTKTLIRWVALYEGEYTAETLPPYIPKGYAVELLECQRYFYKSTMNYCFMFYVRDSGKNHYTGGNTFPIQMRTIPTIKIIEAGAANIPDGTFTIDDYNVFTVTKDGILGANTPLHDGPKSGFPLYMLIEASADL